MSGSKSLGFSKDNCRICNRDFGIFLNIFRGFENRKYYKEIEECLSVKVSKQDNVSLKVCHRCVYNLKLCSDFLYQFNTIYRVLTGPVVGSCYFCLRKNCVLFGIESHIDEAKCTICKIEKCFSPKVPRGLNASCKLCLSCTYRLDIFYELRETAFKTQKLHVKTLGKKLLIAADKKQTNCRTNHHLHLQKFRSACSLKSNTEADDIPGKKSVMKSCKRIKMGTKKNRSGKKVTQEQMQCSIKLIDVMKVDRSKRKRSASLEDERAEKFLKVDDEHVKTSKITTKTKSDTPVKRGSRSPRRTPVRSVTRSPRRTSIKNDTQSPWRTPVNTRSPRRTPIKNDTRSPRRTPVKNDTRSPRRTPVKNDTRSPRRTPVKNDTRSPRRTPVKNANQSAGRTLVKTDIQPQKKAPQRLKIKLNSPGKLKGKKNIQTKKKEKANKTVNKVKSKRKITFTVGSKALETKLKNSKGSETKTLTESRSIKSNKTKPKKASSKVSAKFECSVCNVIFSKKVNVQMHELTHQSKVPMLVLKRCRDIVTNIKTEAIKVNVNKQISETENITLSEQLLEESGSQVAETNEDQKVSLSETVSEEALNQQVENVDLCENHVPPDNLSEDKPDSNIMNEKESESVENKISDDIEITVSDDGDEQEQNNELDNTNAADTVQDDSHEEPMQDIEVTAGNEDNSELNSTKDCIEISKNNNEESTTCGEIDSTNEHNTENAVLIEINNLQEEQMEEKSSLNEDKNEERTDTGDAEVESSEKLSIDNIEKNADNVEFQGMTMVSEEEHVATGSEVEQVAVDSEVEQMAIDSEMDQVAIDSEMDQVAIDSEMEQVAMDSEVEQVAEFFVEDKVEEDKNQSMNNV